MFRRFAVGIGLYILLEIIGIYTVSHFIGGGWTFLLLIAGAVAGGWLMKVEGRKAWSLARQQMEAGQPPGHSILDGLCVLAGGLLLIIPGFISDLVGLALLFPLTRPMFRLALYGWLANRMRSGSFRFIGGGPFRKP